MSTRLDPHEQFAELAAGSALRALEPADEERFAAHLASCARCETDVREHLDTLTHLAYAPASPAPPASLLDGIRAGLLASGREVSFAYGGDDRHEPAAEPAVTRPVAAQPDIRQPAGTEPGGAQWEDAPPVVTRLDDARRRRDRRTRAIAVVAVAAAAAAVLGLGGWGLSLRTDAERQEQQFAAALRELSVPGTTTVPLRRDDGGTVAVALVQGSKVSVLADELPANPDGTVYVLWGRVGIEIRPVGAFDGTGQLATTTGLRVPGDPKGLSQLLLTVEDGDRAPARPGADPIASGQL